MPLLALCAAVLMFGQTSTSTPDQTIQAFVDAWNGDDLGKASAFVKGGTSPGITRSGSSRWPKFSVTNLVDSVVGNRAIVDFHLKTIDGDTTSESDGLLVLVKDGDSWFLDAKQGETLGMAANLFVHQGVFRQAHQAATATVCLSNAKQLALGMIMFTGDSDDKWKVTTQNWFKQITPYVKNPDIIHCPDDKSGNPSYSFNGWLAGKSESSIAAPANTVMIYEGKAGKLDFRHNGRAAIAFVDGHAKLIDAKQAASLVWKP